MHPYISNQRLNRELSWLLFNARVLQEAKDPQVPLIERMRFLGIFSNNQDEFFRVRVATMKRLNRLGKGTRSRLGFSPQKVLNHIQEMVIELQTEFNKIYHDILKELEEENIVIIDETELSPLQNEFVEDYFDKVVEPLLVPIMLKNVPVFPSLKDKSVYLFIALIDEKHTTDLAIMEIPRKSLSRFLVLPSEDDKKYIIYLDDVIRKNLHKVFSIFNYTEMQSYIIKITRDAELDIDDDISESYYDKMKKSVEKRKKGEPVRFIYDKNMPPVHLKYLMKKLRLSEDDNIIPGGRYHNFRDFMKFPNVGGEHLEFAIKKPLPHPDLIGQKSVFSVLDQKDLLLHFPYHTYDHVIDLLREAAIDPKVTQIKISLYRVAGESRIINALVNAVKNGKEVVVVMELQARFDEEANLQWSKALKEEGVQVFFGISGLKIHSKLLLITRKEKREEKYYSFVGTGNFHEGTAKVYSDTALLTANQEIGEEVKRVFTLIAKPYLPVHFDHLLVSPVFMRKRIYELIDREISAALEGKEAAVTLKLNNLVDEEMVDKLYEASRQGVKVNMIIRGICSLIPGIKDGGENIEAVSIVGRYLEHTRIYAFHNGGDKQYYLSSADWMTRNLDYRIEVAVPVLDKSLREELEDFLKLQFKDNVKSRLLDVHMDNRYVKNKKKEVDSQKDFYEYLKNKLGAA
jgi:polyphosphate kinase